MAMSYLLDDPSPKVRQALAEALSSSENAPRPIVIALAEDQAEIACMVILSSPVLTEADLVDLIGRGSSLTRSIVAARADLSPGACAALSEIGGACEVAIMLESGSAQMTPFSIRRVCDRFKGDEEIRNLLLERYDLPADVRHSLVLQVGEALVSAGIITHALSLARAREIIQDASDAATTQIAGNVSGQDVRLLVEHLRQQSKLTAAFLLQLLCTGKLDFFAGAIANLSGLEERRVRSILATGRHHAVRALFQSSGLSGRMLDVFIEATHLWRQASEMPYGGAVQQVATRLLEKFARAEADTTLSEMLGMVEKLQIVDQRQRARSFAQDMIAEAA